MPPLSFLERKYFTNEVKNLVRDVRDYGSKKRQYSTPGPEEICRNIDVLAGNEKWTSKVPASTLKEMTKLRIHAKKGCLRYCFNK
jgi:hypothetical protein